MPPLYKETEIIIADDHPVYRQGVSDFLQRSGIERIRQVENGIELLDQLKTKAADIVLLDIRMGKMNGLEALVLIREQFPLVKVIMLSAYEDAEKIRECHSNGAWGYLSKIVFHREILAAIESVLNDRAYFSSSVAHSLLTDHEQRQRGNLSDREMKVLRLLAEEFTTDEIAGKLFLGIKTIETCRSDLMRKFNATNVAGLIHKAHQRGLLD